MPFILGAFVSEYACFGKEEEVLTKLMKLEASDFRNKSTLFLLEVIRRLEVVDSSVIDLDGVVGLSKPRGEPSGEFIKRNRSKL